MPTESNAVRTNPTGWFVVHAPGIGLASLTALCAFYISATVHPGFPLSPVVVALLIGMALNFVVTPGVIPGLSFCVKVLLRVSVALLGLRISVADIYGLGTGTAVVVIVGMTTTILLTFALARVLGQRAEFAALAGTATAVCGASATLAVSSVLPQYPKRELDIAFTIIAVNALSTIAMLSYPSICVLLGLTERTTGIVLGASIHDVAQVVGAGYGISETVGNTAVIVKLFRVLLLVPVVLLVGSYFRNSVDKTVKSPRVPSFALVFLVLCGINSLMNESSTTAHPYLVAKEIGIQISNWGLLAAIAALGLNTSIGKLMEIGWQRVIVLAVNSILLLGTVILGAAFLAPA